ncbi:hypothetical protein N665_0141s0009 [Sinapis alba]|nr:hypothetical protein N665_0141s0009 [Sinapis alba]
MFSRNGYALFFHVFSRFGVSGARVIVHRSLDLIMTTARLPHQVVYKSLLSFLILLSACCFNRLRYSTFSLTSLFFLSLEHNIPIRMSSPIRCCSLKGKAIATASDSDNGSSPRLLGPRAIKLGGMALRPTSEDLAELNENERSIVQFSLDLEEREPSGQAVVDDATEEIVPSSRPETLPPTTKDKAAAEKEINLHLADLLPMRWTGTNFEFDEEIDPEQERRLSIKKNQRWENHFPTRSTFKSVRRLVLQTNPPAGFSFLIPADHQRPWTPPAGYACVYESWFTNCSLWWTLPEFLTTYCHRRRIALGQYTANGIRILVTLTVLAAELGISMSVCLFEELTTPSIMVKTGFFYGKMVPKYNVITGKPSKVNFWNRAYFYVKINDASFEHPYIVLNGYFNANIDRLSKWSQGGTESFLEEVEAIRTLSHQHRPDISEARIQAALKRISRATDSSPSRISRMGKINVASLPSYADTIGTPVHEAGSPGSGRPAKRRRSETAEEETRRSSPTRSPLTEEPEQNAEDIGRFEGPGNEEILLLSLLISLLLPRCRQRSTKQRGAGALIPTNSTKEEGNARVGALSQSNWYREMTRAGAIFFGSANLMVRDYEAKLKAQDEKIASKTGALKKKRKEIAKLAYKCGSYEEQIGALDAEKIEAAEHAEALSKVLEEIKALNGGLETRCHNLEQENTEILVRFETTTRRLRESREHEARADEAKYQGDLQGMEVVEASEIDLTLIGVDEHGSNMTVFSPQDIEDLRSE